MPDVARRSPRSVATPGVRLDVSDPVAIRALVAAVVAAVRRHRHPRQQRGRVAAGAAGGPDDMFEAAWERTLAVNLTAQARLARACLPHLRPRAPGASSTSPPPRRSWRRPASPPTPRASTASSASPAASPPSSAPGHHRQLHLPRPDPHRHDRADPRGGEGRRTPAAGCRCAATATPRRWPTPPCRSCSRRPASSTARCWRSTAACTSGDEPPTRTIQRLDRSDLTCFRHAPDRTSGCPVRHRGARRLTLLLAAGCGTIGAFVDLQDDAAGRTGSATSTSTSTRQRWRRAAHRGDRAPGRHRGGGAAEGGRDRVDHLPPALRAAPPRHQRPERHLGPRASSSRSSATRPRPRRQGARGRHPQPRHRPAHRAGRRVRALRRPRSS